MWGCNPHMALFVARQEQKTEGIHVFMSLNVLQQMISCVLSRVSSSLCH